MHMSQATVSRMLKRAEQEEIVRTTVVSAARHLCRRWRPHCASATALPKPSSIDCSEDRDGAIMARIGEAAAHFLETTMQQGEIIGVSSWSQTILEAWWTTSTR
jgi:DNA-binding transcriptional regulator LsrR (DeoR family)